MKIKVRKHVVYEIFDNKVDMIRTILKMFELSKLDKIIYKGDPKDISTKTMKVVIVRGCKKMSADEIKNKYDKLLKKGDKYCIIYRTN